MDFWVKLHFCFILALQCTLFKDAKCFCIKIDDIACPEKYVRFVLFTQQNLNVGEDVTSNTISSSKYFNTTNPTKFIIHGFNSNIGGAFNTMKNDYLYKGEYNIFLFDWSKLCTLLCYIDAVSNLNPIANCVSNMIKKLVSLNAENIHIVGHSLGAQMMNYISLHLGQSFRVPRMTGLDPALPDFNTKDKNAKLDSSDANYVDVIHTNAFATGQIEQCGHADFYMNGGSYQPGCLLDFVACSHHRAILYFSESIRSTKGFWGWKCPSYQDFRADKCPKKRPFSLAGEFIEIGTNGVFYVVTASKSPFALGRNLKESFFPIIRLASRNAK